MPRPSALSKVSTAALHAELERRVGKLAELLKLREDLDAQIAALTAVAGQFAPAAAEAPVKPVRRKRRKAGMVAKAVASPVAAEPAAKTRTVRKTYAVTADEFVLGLLKGKTLTTRQLGEAWKNAGRGGPVDAQLSRLVKLGKLNRKPLGGKLGSNYSLA